MWVGAVAIVSGVSEGSLKPKTLSGQGATEAVFVKEIDSNDSGKTARYAGDNLYTDERYEYVVDKEENYVKRISLTDKKDWDPLLEAPAGDFTEENAVKMAEDVALP